MPDSAELLPHFCSIRSAARSPGPLGDIRRFRLFGTVCLAGTGTSRWGVVNNDTGIAIHPDGGLRLKHDDDGVYEMSTADASATYLFTIAFDDTDTLFGIVESTGALYEIDSSDASIDALVGNTGFSCIRSLSFDRVTGMFFGHDNDTGNLVEIDPADASATVVGPTGSLLIASLAFAPDGTLYGWHGRSDSDINSGPFDTVVSGLLEIDPQTGAASPIGRYGPFDAALTLFDSNGLTPLAHSVASGLSEGAQGSIDPRDPYIEYDLTESGVYYVRVGQDGGLPVPLAGSYELQCSLEGGELPVELLFKDGFE